MKIEIDIPNEYYADDIMAELDEFLTDYFCGTVCKVTPLLASVDICLDLGRKLNIAESEK